MNGSIMHLHVTVKVVHGDELEAEDIVQELGYHFNSGMDCAKVVGTEIVELTGVDGFYDPENFIDLDLEDPYYDPDSEKELDAALGLLQALRCGQYEDSIWPEVDEMLEAHGIKVDG